MSNLIFVVSQPRCGSTLLQTLISNNEYVNTASEPWVLLPFITYKSPDIQNGIYNSQLAKLGIEDYVSVAGNNTDLVKIALQNFFKEIYSPLESVNTKYILDKTPRYYEILPLLTEYFPQAKIIILKRNPLSVLQSIMTTWDVQSFPDLSIYARDILNAPFLIENFWKENKNNPNVIEVFYEELTNNPDNEIEKIYNWLGLEFNLEVLNYKKNNKMTGSMGDKAGFVQNDKIVQGKSINLDNESTFWRNFFIGYLDYLGNDFLMQYGNYKFDFKLHPTKEFNDFSFVTKMDYLNNKQLSFKNLIKLILYKIRAKFKTEYKY